jgi:peptide/nickel transport system permease protein
LNSLRRFLGRWQNWLGLLLVFVFLIIAITAPLLSPQDPDNPGPLKIVGKVTDLEPHPPSELAPLGTLPKQISIYHALVWGTRSALLFGVTVAFFVALIGVLIGTISAYSGGFFSKLLMRMTDAFLAFPVIAGVVLMQQLITNVLYNFGVRIYQGGLVGFVSPGGLFTELPTDIPRIFTILLNVDPILVAFILFSWMPYARMMNTVVMQIKQNEYIEASRALGAGHTRLIFRHLIPNAITPAIVLAARDVGGMVLLQATFTFIGFGDSSPWGLILVRGRDWIVNPGGIFAYWWVFLPATLALLLFGIGWNLVGDGLNDALNPRTR